MINTPTEIELLKRANRPRRATMTARRSSAIEQSAAAALSARAGKGGRAILKRICAEICENIVGLRTSLVLQHSAKHVKSAKILERGSAKAPPTDGSSLIRPLSNAWISEAGGRISAKKQVLAVSSRSFRIVKWVVRR